MQICHVWIGAGVAFAVELFAVHVAAQPNFDIQINDARAQLDQADRAFREGRYQDAASSYLAADRLQPTPALQLALGKTYEQLNDTSRALSAYREYFERDPDAPDRAEVRTQVNALALKLSKQGVQQIHVSSEPGGATVTVDGTPRGVTPFYVDLPPGQHIVGFDLQGFKHESVGFELRSTEPLNVMTTLAAAPAAAEAVSLQPQPSAAALEVVAATPAPASASAPEQPASGATWMRTAGFVALAGSVVALGTAVGFEVARADTESSAVQEREQIAFKEDLDTASSQQTAARVFAVSAGVLAAAGGILLVLASEHSEASPSSGGVAVACGVTECGASYRRQF